MPSKKSKKDPSAPPKAVAKGRPKAKAAPPSTKGAVYQLKITLNDIRPPIWRRVLTKDCTLAKLHDIIQAVMGWDDYHLHEFEIGEQRYGDPVQWNDDFWGDDTDMGNEGKVKLSQLVQQGVKKLRYQYDMGDSWWHTVTVEKTLPAETGVKYPRCVAGERACPPEDCGGPWGYGDFVDAIQNPKHKQHNELLDGVGGEFDPEAFDLGAANEQLQARA